VILNSKSSSAFYLFSSVHELHFHVKYITCIKKLLFLYSEMSAPSGQAIALEPLPPQGPRKRKKKRKQKNPEETEIPINASGETTQPQSM